MINCYSIPYKAQTYTVDIQCFSKIISMDYERCTAEGKKNTAVK